MKKLTLSTIALSFLILSSGVASAGQSGYLFDYDDGTTLYGGDVQGYSFTYRDGTTLYDLR